MILSDAARSENTRFVCLYDFGDNWRHEVLIEAILAPAERLRHPVCVAGERHCPPEDCGGVPGYEEFLEAIRDPSHPQHNEMLAWIGGGRFDPEGFNLDAVNRVLRRIRWSGRPQPR